MKGCVLVSRLLSIEEEKDEIREMVNPSTLSYIQAFVAPSDLTTK